MRYQRITEKPSEYSSINDDYCPYEEVRSAVIFEGSLSKGIMQNIEEEGVSSGGVAKRSWPTFPLN